MFLKALTCLEGHGCNLGEIFVFGCALFLSLNVSMPQCFKMSVFTNLTRSVGLTLQFYFVFLLSPVLCHSAKMIYKEILLHA